LTEGQPRSDDEVSADDGATGLGELGDVAARDLSRVANEDAERILEVFEKHLGGEIDSRTYEELTFGVSVYLDPNTLALLTWLAQAGGGTPSERIASLQLEQPAEDVVRRVISLHGARLIRAAFAADPPAPNSDDWRKIDREILLDPESGEYVVRLLIRKQNGETQKIEGDATSMVKFARFSLRTLILIGDPDALPVDDASQLAEAWEELQPILPDVADEEGADQA
jgi:hypothetical protein